MDADRDAVPDEIAALKKALAVERTKGLEIAAELAVARAKVSEDEALIAQHKLQIANLNHQIYGLRSDRSTRLIEQFALVLEELEATPPRTSWRQNGHGEDGHGARIYAQAAPGARPSPCTFPGARSDRRAYGLSMLRQQSPSQARRGRNSSVFCGSDRGGRPAEPMYSLIVTAKMNGADPQA